jgi:hypothetical protein
MKNEKLELLKNKVVNVKTQDNKSYSGFLTWNDCSYQVKIIDVTSGNFNIDEIINIADTDNVTVSEKPKLMGIKKNSWHYHLMSYVLRSNVPTPKTMQNGCPYWWLLIFSLGVCIPLTFFRLLGKFFKLFPMLFYKYVEVGFYNWLESMEDTEIFDSPKSFSFITKIYLNYTNNYSREYGVVVPYIERKFGFKYGSPEYNKIREDILTKWNEKLYQRNVKEENQNIEEQLAARMREQKRQEAKKRWEQKIMPINDGIENFFSSIENGWHNMKSQKNLIKKTKQVMGFFITIGLLILAYFVVNLITSLLIWTITIGIMYWIWLAYLGLAAIGCGILYVLIVVIGSWLQGIVEKYNKGKKVWYIEPIIWVIWYPIKYVVLGILYGFFFGICIPIKFIFYTFLGKMILWNLGGFLWRIIAGLWKVLLSSTGIFGEYFSASYSSYCPGIEWIGFDDEK